jgi:hypothetical protein
MENIYAGRVDMISAKTIQLRSNGLGTRKVCGF